MKKLGILFIIIMAILTAIYVLLHPSDDEFVNNDLYDEIMQRKVLKVGINPNSKPFGFIDKDGNYAGYDVDLAKYTAQYILKNPNAVVFVPVTTSNRLIKASTGEVDIVISTVTITPQRQEVVAFSMPYDKAGQALLVKADSSVKSIADLAGESVGVIFGTTAEKNMRNMLPTATIVGFKTYPDAYNALLSGEITAITSDDTILSRFVADGKNVKLLPKRYSQEPYGIAFKKGSSSKKFKEHLDSAIKDLQRKGVIQRLHNKWNIYN